MFQWRQNPGNWAITFTTWASGGVCNTRRETSSTWDGCNESLTLTGYAASHCYGGKDIRSSYGYAISIGI